MLYLGPVLLVVPVAVVQPLSALKTSNNNITHTIKMKTDITCTPEEFDRWNSSADIFLRQIQVVDEDDALFAHGRPVHPLPPPVQLGHDHVLGVVHVRPRREVDDVVDELLGGETCDQAACQKGLASSCGSHLFLQEYFLSVRQK